MPERNKARLSAVPGRNKPGRKGQGAQSQARPD